MKIKNLLLILTIQISSLLAATSYAPNSECKECHPDIYAEYEKSMHRNSTIWKDPIHKAVWDMHPVNTKKQQYKCAKCHIPTADNISDMLGKDTKGIPDSTNETHTQGILCTYCHKIESVEEGLMSNTNKMADTKYKDYFGTRDNPKRTRYHYSVKNENFANGKVCMGCHSHKKNKARLDVCVTDMGEADDKENCITCHMPQVKGSMSTKADTPTYAFHGFPGANLHKDMLTKYIDMKFVEADKGFKISIHNESSHNLMLHPMRFTQLLVSVERDGKVEDMKPEIFVRMIGKDEKPSPPWIASEVVKDTMIKGKETRLVNYDQVVQKGDKVHATLGYYLVKPQVAKRFGIEINEHIDTFHILKKVTHIIK